MRLHFVYFDIRKWRTEGYVDALPLQFTHIRIQVGITSLRCVLLRVVQLVSREFVDIHETHATTVQSVDSFLFSTLNSHHHFALKLMGCLIDCRTLISCFHMKTINVSLKANIVLSETILTSSPTIQAIETEISTCDVSFQIITCDVSPNV